MLITPHVIAGAYLGKTIKKPLIIIPVVITSHFVLDMIPHWQFVLAPYLMTREGFIFSFFDAVLAGLLMLLILITNKASAWLILIGSIFAVLPDFDFFVPYSPQLQLGYIKLFTVFHLKIQNETNSLLGLLPQLIVILLFLYLSLKKPSKT